MIKLVAIDVDDTLCMTEEACFHMENEAAAQLGYPPMERAVHRHNWGHPLEEAITKRFPGIHVGRFMRELTKLVPQYVSQGKLDDIQATTLNALDTLRNQGVSLAILTSRSSKEVTHFLEKNHPLQKRIQGFYHKDNSEFGKPDPRVFIQILKQFEVLPHESVYIGDTVTDAQCAKSAGLYFIATLENNLRSQSDFAHTSVDAFIRNFTEVPQVITALGE